jgi:hypothetical protein
MVTDFHDPSTQLHLPPERERKVKKRIRILALTLLPFAVAAYFVFGSLGVVVTITGHFILGAWFLRMYPDTSDKLW